MLWLLVTWAAAATAASLVDTLLAVVDDRTVAASDIALARALGLPGFAPSAAPIARDEVERFIDMLLIVDEAGRVGITAEPELVDRAWAAVATRAGGAAALASWLERHAIDHAWARRLVEQDVVRTQFYEARFAAIVFPDEAQIAAALGPGPHVEAAREAARARLARETAERAQAEWLAGARQRATIQILPTVGVSLPFPAPP